MLTGNWGHGKPQAVRTVCSYTVLRCVSCACGPVTTHATCDVTRSRRAELEFHPLDVSRSGLVSLWYVAWYLWDIEEIEPQVGYQPAETGLN